MFFSFSFVWWNGNKGITLHPLSGREDTKTIFEILQQQQTVRGMPHVGMQGKRITNRQ